MKAARQEALKAAMLSLLILSVLLGLWHLATLQSKAVSAPAVALTAEQIEYAKLMGKDPASLASNAATGTSGKSGKSGKSGFPTLSQMGVAIARNLASPFYDNGPNDKGVGRQLACSLGRVGLGCLLAALVAIPLVLIIGMSPLVYRALDPFIHLLGPSRGRRAQPGPRRRFPGARADALADAAPEHRFRGAQQMAGLGPRAGGRASRRAGRPDARHHPDADDGNADGSTTGLIESAHAAGLFVHAFTFRNDASGYGFEDPKTEMTYYFNLGVDGVFTDFADTGVAALAASWPS